MSNEITSIYEDIDGAPLPADEADELARHIADQGEEAGFSPAVVADARERIAS